MFEFTMEKDIVFANGDAGCPEKTGEMEMTLDLYRPVATDELPETLSAVIFVFGGGHKAKVLQLTPGTQTIALCSDDIIPPVSLG
jgi:hypothetical protein